MVDEAVTGMAPSAPLVGVPTFEASFEELFQVSYRVAFRILGQREDADDVADSVLAKAWLRWDRMADHAPAWVARASANAAISVLRRRRLFDRLPLTTSLAPSMSLELRDELVRALRRLPSRQREVLVLRYLADLPLGDVANAMGLSVGTVKGHAHRALQTLRADRQLTREER